MSQKLSNKHSVNIALKREQAAVEKAERALQRARDKEEQKAVSLYNWARHKDARSAGLNQENLLKGKASSMWAWDAERLFELFCTTPMTVEVLAERLAQVETMNRYRKPLEDYIHAKFVESAERQLEEFERINSKDLKGKKLTALPEPKSSSMPLPTNFYNDGTASALTKKSISYLGQDGKLQKPV